MDDSRGNDDAAGDEAKVGHEGAPVAVVVFEDTEAASARARALRDGPFRLLWVRSLTEAATVVATRRPDVVFVDGSLGEPCPEALAMVFAAARGALCVVLLPDTTGQWVQLAHQCGADVLIPPPLQRATVMRLATECAERSVSSGAGPGTESIVLPALVDRSEPMRDVWRLVALASRCDASVVIRGETGVGKEVVARALHRFSRRRHRPFVAINCAALPETLLESELFGHEKGAFTGASGQHKGRFELADGGTLFLDEVGDLPLGLQVKLLRVLQEQRFERVGGMKTISVDVRIVSATHRNLERAVSRGRFRADLYYRIRVLSIRIAPLRQRREDILPLWDRFLLEEAAREGRAPPPTTVAAHRRLLQHPWPGNVRELHNAAQHALLLAGSREILPADLPELSGEGAPPDGSTLGMTLQEIERAAVLDTLEAVGTIKAAARVLGVSERKLHYRLKRYREDGSIDTRRSASALHGRRAPAQSDEASGASDPPEVLLAEDDDELRWGLHDLLQGAGYRVVAVRDGRALLERLGAAVLLEQRDARPDAIVTDVRMPFLSGFQLLENVRNRGWSTPVVMMSAFASEGLRQRARHLGAVAFLDKPLDTEVLLRVLRDAVGP